MTRRKPSENREGQGRPRVPPRLSPAEEGATKRLPEDSDDAVNVDEDPKNADWLRRWVREGKERPE